MKATLMTAWPLSVMPPLPPERVFEDLEVKGERLEALGDLWLRLQSITG